MIPYRCRWPYMCNCDVCRKRVYVAKPFLPVEKEWSPYPVAKEQRE